MEFLEGLLVIVVVTAVLLSPIHQALLQVR